MKLKALALGVALAFPMMASAQQSSTSVTLYGIVDTGIEYVNNIYDPATGEDHSSVHFTNLTQSVPSRWGLRGTEDLGNGLSAVFTLESGFNAGTGTSGQGGRLFGRQAWVGLKGDFGQIAFGRQYNMLFWSLLGADIMGPNAYGLGSLDNYIPNTRMDNSITYRGDFNGFKFGAAYARGRDTVATGGPAASNCGVDYTDQSGCSAYSAYLGFDTANWGVAGAYDVITGSDNFANFQGLGEDDKDRRWTVNGYVKFDALKVGLVYLNRKNDGVNGIAPGLGEKSDLWSLGAAYQVSPAVTLDGSVNYIRYKDADESSKAWYYVARATYSFSKRTAAYTSVGYIRNKGLSALSAAGGTAPAPAPEAGGNQTAVMIGLRHSF
ncbi:porin [Pusillimonas caeni]|uniref:porin n=1 Tax=Pusillimonas caeni TaxID=1348472 RepID=UPI000E59D5E6|nr:porin [Pusillimonas caeni]TFL11179.1 porin [Pusillimonas caeni]